MQAKTPAAPRYRAATPAEVAAYRADVAPVIGTVRAVEQVRVAHKMFVSYLTGSPRYLRRA